MTKLYPITIMITITDYKIMTELQSHENVIAQCNWLQLQIMITTSSKYMVKFIIHLRSMKQI